MVILLIGDIRLVGLATQRQKLFLTEFLKM